jgi:hypothetical protein
MPRSVRRARLPLLLAAALAGLAALLLGLSEAPRAEAPTPPPGFPTMMRPVEWKRSHERRTLPPLPGPVPQGDEPPPRRDPFLVALPRDPKRPIVVLEANALRHSRLGELFVECVFTGGRRDPLEPIRRELGIDPLKDVDRIALSEEGAVISGFFEKARLEGLARGATVSSYGDAGKVYFVRGERPDGGGVLGTWGGSMIVFGERAFVEQSIDRLEGRAAEAEPVIPESLTYGEAYGVLPGAALGDLFRGDQADLGRRLAEVASRIEVHADAMNDVAMTARVSGPDREALRDLGSAVGAALAVARLQARVRGDERIAQLLEHARVERSGDAWFTVELAIPVAVLESWFAGCGATAAAPAGRE